MISKFDSIFLIENMIDYCHIILESLLQPKTAVSSFYANLLTTSASCINNGNILYLYLPQLHLQYSLLPCATRVFETKLGIARLDSKHDSQ